jgi:hypothetical protein
VRTRGWPVPPLPAWQLLTLPTMTMTTMRAMRATMPRVLLVVAVACLAVRWLTCRLSTRDATRTRLLCATCAFACATSLWLSCSVLATQRRSHSPKANGRAARIAFSTTRHSGKQSLGWASGARGSERLLLVCRYSLDELDDLIASARKRMLAGSDAGVHLAGSKR